MTAKQPPQRRRDFLYEKGPLVVRTPWKRPSKDRFEGWWSAFSKHVAKTPYWVWLCGGYLENKRYTWDVDIVLSKPTHPHQSEYDALARLMLEGSRLAHESYELLVDIQFYCNMESRLDLPHQAASFWYSTEDWLANGTTQLSSYIFFEHIRKNGQTLFSGPVRRLGNGIFEIRKTWPSIKYRARFHSDGYRYQDPKLLH
ncbi:MAG: hypothetical protein AAFN74_18705, partial [Myxococcota bacterium]